MPGLVGDERALMGKDLRSDQGIRGAETRGRLSTAGDGGGASGGPSSPRSPSRTPRPGPLITPAVFSQPPPRPPGEEGERPSSPRPSSPAPTHPPTPEEEGDQQERSNRVPLSRLAGGGGRGDRDEGLGGGPPGSAGAPPAS